MNELEQVTRFREQVGEPDTAHVAAARARLLATPSPSPRRPRVRRRLVLAGTAALTAAAVVTGGVVLRGPEGGPTAVAEVLRRTARSAAGAAPVELKPGQYWYTRSTGAGLTTYADDPMFSVLTETTTESWRAADGSGRMAGRSGKVTFAGPKDRANWIAQGRPELDDRRTNERFGKGELSFGTTGDGSYRSLLGLPADPDELYEHFRAEAEGHSRGTNVETFVLITDLLEEPAPPALRAALFEALAKVPGVELLGEATDPAGREGVGIGLSDREGLRTEVIFEPGTGMFLSRRDLLVKRMPGVDAEPGTVISHTTLLATGVVESVTAKP